MTEVLEHAGSQTLEVNGERITGKRLIARMLWDLAKTGRTKFPDGTELKTASNGLAWFEVVRFLYQHIDGPPRTDVDVTTGGEKLQLAQVVIVLPDNSRGEEDDRPAAGPANTVS